MQRQEGMRITKLLAPALVVAALFVPGVASADNVFDTLRFGVQRLADREQVIRDRAAKSHSPQLEKESARRLATVDTERRFILARLGACTLLPDQRPDDDVIADTAHRLNHAEGEMAALESWFPKR